MQRVIDNLLYDTDTATIVHVEEDTKRVLYITPNKNFFMFYPIGEIVPKTEQSAKNYLGKYNVEKYIELFGEPEEA
ncbi:MAG: hypothetical protein J6Q48_10525 [Bacteroidaceae bacterium]|nr:hypothetical protein [Bacteroidaceae bacterium]